MPDACVVCLARPGPVCDEDLAAIDKQLEALPRRLAAVAGALLPGRAPAAERVSVSTHVAAGLPARLDALSLLGPGADVTRLHPLVRHWSTTRQVAVTTLRAGLARTVQVTVTDWFSEAVLDADGEQVMVADEDQIGAVPPREWLDMQVRRWRAHLGHHVPPRTLRPRRDLRAHLPGAYLSMLRTTGGGPVLAFLAAVREVGGAYARNAHFGLLGYEDPAARSTDPVLDALERRSGRTFVPNAVQWDIDYLRTWLARACAEDALDLAVFAAQLRGIHAEIGRVLGDTPDQTWVGRCPAFIADVGPDGEPAGRKRPCGAGLWQDNTAFAAQVRCPRCRSVWDTRGHAGAGTAREIRKVWPVDRRRRYTAAEIDRLTPPKCAGCGLRVKVQWRDMTGTGDAQRLWQPTAAHCDNGCDEARRVV